MAGAECDIRIGTSGWHYDDWRGRFYPEGLPKNKWFEFYSRHFDTVEVNNTFYRLPKVKSVENWYARAPKDFVYAVKASRFITHIKKLKDAAEPLERFFDVVGLLKDRLGPVLYQLPPSMNRDLARLEDFIELLPKGRAGTRTIRSSCWINPARPFVFTISTVKNRPA